MNDFTETEEDKIPNLSSFSPEERRLMGDASPTEIRTLSRLTYPDLERMIVGHLIGQPVDGKKPSTIAADKIVEAQIAPDWFEDKISSSLFNDFITWYRSKRTLLTVDEAYNQCLIQGMDPNQASNYKHKAIGCHAISIVRSIDVDILIERMLIHHLQKRQNEIWETACAERRNPNIGPRKSYENMREACVRDLIDPRGATIKHFDLVKNGAENLEWLRDMKYHPEKYRGMRCGIPAIDIKTLGFRAGQLTVFVGYHGGYKTTTMMNVGYGLYDNGANVLYVSLEMEPQIVQTKLLCRGTLGKIGYSRVYNGTITEPCDFARLIELEHRKSNPALSAEERSSAEAQHKELGLLLLNKEESTADVVIAKQFYENQAKRPNKFVVATIGQSEKMKLSQLERWLHEQAAIFKPDVVILDYLDLLQPEIVNPNRLDVGFGDICKMSRQMGKNMGFSVITAAQMKRAAVERLRKTGLDTPEKAQFGTDDISGSGQIGADADNAFVLWKKGQNKIQLFTIKSRYSAMDNTTGNELEVDYESCLISDKQIHKTSEVSNKKSMGDAEEEIDKYMKLTRTNMPEELDDVFSPGGDDMDDGIV